jgi:hypothetical protein
VWGAALNNLIAGGSADTKALWSSLADTVRLPRIAIKKLGDEFEPNSAIPFSR